jgi:hypothetical protein
MPYIQSVRRQRKYVQAELNETCPPNIGVPEEDSMYHATHSQSATANNVSGENREKKHDQGKMRAARVMRSE